MSTAMIKTRPLEVARAIEPEQFRSTYYHPGEPVILDDVARTWPAIGRWTSDYLREKCGNARVGCVDDDYGTPGPNYLSDYRWMTLAEYLDIIDAGPSKLRLFIWEFSKNAPALLEDIREPAPHAPIARFRGYHIFAGGTGSTAHFHYDLDLRNVFHTVVRGRKRVLLASPRASRDLYRHPMTTRTYIDVDRPDFARYPRLANVELREATLEAGQTLFIPYGWWHYFHYLDRGFAVTHRYQVNAPFMLFRLLYNFARNRADRALNRLMGRKWHDLRERWVAGH